MSASKMTNSAIDITRISYDKYKYLIDENGHRIKKRYNCVIVDGKHHFPYQNVWVEFSHELKHEALFASLRVEHSETDIFIPYSSDLYHRIQESGPYAADSYQKTYILMRHERNPWGGWDELYEWRFWYCRNEMLLEAAKYMNKTSMKISKWPSDVTITFDSTTNSSHI